MFERLSGFARMEKRREKNTNSTDAELNRISLD
jgi:hypothetical protein